MARFRYNPLTDPRPTRMFHGWASRAQRRHFLGDTELHKYIGGNDYFSPRRGHGSVREKLSALPSRLRPKRRRSRTTRT